MKGAKASRNGPKVSHFLFADDCILFGQATSREANFLKEILGEYRSCSGQCVNFNKSTVSFSSDTNDEDRREVVNILGVSSSENPEYLGSPNTVGIRKKETFQSLKDRFKKCIDNWNN